MVVFVVALTTSLSGLSTVNLAFYKFASGYIMTSYWRNTSHGSYAYDVTTYTLITPLHFYYEKRYHLDSIILMLILTQKIKQISNLPVPLDSGS